MIKDLPDNHDLSHLAGALKYVTNFNTALDVGAHRGIWTKELVKRFKIVIAFEPTERAKLITNEAIVISYAVGKENKMVSMREGSENTGQAHVIDGSDVKMITIDSLDLFAIDFIKYDVEGLEHEAIEGSIETLKRCKPAVMIEENGLCERYGYKWGDAGKLLESIGYRHVDQWNKDHLYLWGE